jgi:hypothetical protein
MRALDRPVGRARSGMKLYEVPVCRLSTSLDAFAALSIVDLSTHRNRWGSASRDLQLEFALNGSFVAPAQIASDRTALVARCR